MELDRVKYTQEGRPYIELTIKSGARKGEAVKRFGKISTCQICKKEFFTRETQLKRGGGKFCSVRCAKTFTKEIKREKEISSRYSKEIKGRIVHFREDGKIYTEKKDDRGKLYRYYGQLRKCLTCGEDFFADFSQIKLNKAKFCSLNCAQLEKSALPKDEAAVIKEEVIPTSEGTVPIEKEMYKTARIDLEREFYKREQTKIRKEETIRRRQRPTGVLVFGIVIIYVGIYYLITGLRISNAIEVSFGSYILAAINLLLGYGILIMRHWVTIFLYTYLAITAGMIITSYLFAFLLDPAFKNLAFSREFVIGVCLVFIPYIFVLAYLTHPDVKEQFR